MNDQWRMIDNELSMINDRRHELWRLMMNMNDEDEWWRSSNDNGYNNVVIVDDDKW